MSNLEPRDSIVLEDFRSAVDSAGMADSPDHSGDTDVGHDYGVALGLCEEDRIG